MGQYPVKTITLNNGIEMPLLGLGVYKAQPGGELEEAIETALGLGYTSFDTAALYDNEDGVGYGLKDAGVKREDVFITTKVANEDQGYDETLDAFDRSLELLQLDYVDLYLVHWPVTGKFLDTWKAMEQIYEEGKARAIGVCNFEPHHLDELLENCIIVPAVNQIEFHPRLTQKELLAYCEERNIKVEAWSPIMRGQLTDHPVLNEIAEKYQKSVAQIILRWDIEHGVITIPKSTNKARLEENINVFDFSLTEEEINRIDELNENYRTGPNPNDF